MCGSMIKVMAATAAFGLVHSTLASRRAKLAAANAFGDRLNGLYRVFYLAQSAATFGMLAAYLRRLPSRELYRVRGPLAIRHAGQAVALLHATAAARQVGIPRILGLEEPLLARRTHPCRPNRRPRGRPSTPRGCARRRAFRLEPTPAQLWPLPLFWLHTRMTTSLLAFNIAATVYLVLGSLHKENRLREAYGETYSAYQRSGVPFYLPSPDQAPFVPIGAVAHLPAGQDDLEGSNP